MAGTGSTLFSGELFWRQLRFGGNAPHYFPADCFWRQHRFGGNWLHLRLFNIFYLQRKFSIFLSNDNDCKVVDPYKARKRYTVTKSLDLNVSCKIRKPNKNFLKLECDWWCLYFDRTDGYLRFISTNGQMTVPLFSGLNSINKRRNQPKNIAHNFHFTTAQLEKW